MSALPLLSCSYLQSTSRVSPSSITFCFHFPLVSSAFFTSTLHLQDYLMSQCADDTDSEVATALLITFTSASELWARVCRNISTTTAHKRGTLNRRLKHSPRHSLRQLAGNLSSLSALIDRAAHERASFTLAHTVVSELVHAE